MRAWARQRPAPVKAMVLQRGGSVRLSSNQMGHLESDRCSALSCSRTHNLRPGPQAILNVDAGCSRESP